MRSGGSGGVAPGNTRVLRQSDYWSVLDTATGRKIADCGTQGDALALVAFDPAHRTATRSKHLAGPVVDVAVQPLLPTSSPVPAAGSPGSAPVPVPAGPLALAAGEGVPVVV